MRRPRCRRCPARPPARSRRLAVRRSSLIGGGWLWLRDSLLVAVRKVTVTGVSGPDAPQVRAALERCRPRHDHAPRPPGRAADRGRPVPGVIGVTTSADFPHGLRIAVHERNAVGAVVAGASASRSPPTGRSCARRRPRPAAIAAKARRRGAHADDSARSALGVLAAAPARCARRSSARYVGDARLDARARATARSCTSAAASGSRPSGPRSRACSQDQSSAGATYLDVRLPERAAAGGLAPLHPEPPRRAPADRGRAARAAVHDDPRNRPAGGPARAP